MARPLLERKRNTRYSAAMPSTPAPTALNDYLTVARPRARLIRPCAQADDAGEAERDASRALCREALACETGGWPTDALFHLRKIVELAVHLGLAELEE